MIGPAEIAIALGAFLLLGGGGGGALVAMVRRTLAARAKDVVEAEVRKAVPAEVRDLARKLGRPIDGDPEPRRDEPPPR